MTATAFECDGAWAAPYWGGYQYVAYTIVPTTPVSIAATATITGRNDPDHSNDVGTVLFDVPVLAAELAVWFEPPVRRLGRPGDPGRHRQLLQRR